MLAQVCLLGCAAGTTDRGECSGKAAPVSAGSVTLASSHKPGVLMCKSLVRLVSIFLSLLSAQAAFAQQQIEVLWLGHSTFRLTSTAGKVIVIDPFFLKNPKAPAKYRDLKAVGKVDLILVTHGHGDHVSDAAPLASLTGAQVVAAH